MLLDLSATLGPNPSEQLPLDIEYLDHRTGGSHLAELACVAQAQLPDGLGWASERVNAITHTGTHVDAPYHYAPKCAGAAARTIDEVPLDWFWGPAVCIHAADKAPEVPIEPDDVLAFEMREEVRIAARTIVLFDTGAVYGSTSFHCQGRPISPATIEALCARGVRVIGTDAWSIDPPFERVRESEDARRPGHVWAAHYTGRNREFCIIEKLCNLSRLPSAGFQVACFPVKLSKASAAWTRAVAFIQEDLVC